MLFPKRKGVLKASWGRGGVGGNKEQRLGKLSDFLGEFQSGGEGSEIELKELPSGS